MSLLRCADFVSDVPRVDRAYLDSKAQPQIFLKRFANDSREVWFSHVGIYTQVRDFGPIPTLVSE